MSFWEIPSLSSQETRGSRRQSEAESLYHTKTKLIGVSLPTSAGLGLSVGSNLDALAVAEVTYIFAGVAVEVSRLLVAGRGSCFHI